MPRFPFIVDWFRSLRVNLVRTSSLPWRRRRPWPAVWETPHPAVIPSKVSSYTRPEGLDSGIFVEVESRSDCATLPAAATPSEVSIHTRGLRIDCDIRWMSRQPLLGRTRLCRETLRRRYFIHLLTYSFMLDDEDDAALVEAAKQAELQAASATADPINMTTEPFIQARAH